MEAKIQLVTPEMAKEFLQRNSNNYRKLSESVVRSYRIDMESGNWKFNGDSVKFNKSGLLVDGQHRLTAIVRSGVSVPMVVITDIDDDVNIYDIGKARTLKDIAYASGMCYGAHNNTTIGAVSFLIRGATGGAVPKQKAISIIQKEEQTWSDCYYSTRRGEGKHPIACRSACVLTVYCLTKQKASMSDVSDFFYVVNTGFPISGRECSPAIVFRNFLLNGKACNNTHVGRTLIFSSCMSAIKDFIDGSSRKKAYSLDESHVAFLKALRNIAIGE